MYEPEPSVEPREPGVFDECILCGGEIYMGEVYYEARAGRICLRCMEGAEIMERVAGED